ncbi:PAS domain-containing protein [Natronorubrum texcoconense]|uniref:PAS domain-containing protein n=1 Tax=Natronorubrum texcoconense TaxID=1095776 RepID=UPI0015870664|nr:PAS domain-containing protein [Natronorubrum texcoconense]
MQERTLYNVTTFEAQTIDSAEYLLDQNEIACVVSEYRLDGGVGAEVVHQTDDVPIILFVEDGSEAIASEAVSSGVDEYVPRDDDLETYHELADTVAETVIDDKRDDHSDATLTDVPVDSLPIVLFSIDANGIITHSQGQGLIDLGIEPGELVGESLYERYADLPGAIEGYETALTGEQTVTPLELNERIIETTFSPLGDRNTVKGVVGLSIDITEQVDAKHETRQLYTAIETTMDGVALLDSEGEYFYLNEAHAKMYGFDDLEELIGESWQTLYDDEELERFDQEIMPVIGREGEWRGEATGRRIDGTRFPQELTLTALDAGGLICVVRDISEQKSILDELSRTRAELQAVLDNALAAIYMRDPEGRYRYVNEQFEDLVGLTDEELLENQPTAVHEDEELIETIEAGDREALDAGEAVKREEEVWIKNRRRTFVTTKVPLFEESGEPYAVYGIATEITEMKERERVLHSLNEVAPQFMNASGPIEISQIAVKTAQEVLDLPIAGLCRYDDEENVLVPFTTTDQADALFEEKPVFQPGQGLAWEVFDSKEPQIVQDVASNPNVYNPETPIRSEMILPLGEHGVLICGSLQHKRFDEYDHEFGTILAATTTSALTRADRERELKRRDRELERKNDRLNEFANVVAHDIRNPLTVAKGYLGLEREDQDSPHLETAEEGIDRTFEIVENLLSLARAGEQVGEVERVSVDDVSKQVWSMVCTDEARLLVEDEVTVEGDQLRLTQLFENFFRNAIEHGGSDVTVRIGELERAQGFYVEDDGLGIPEEKRETLFADQEIRDQDDQRRFGLAIISDILGAHDWEITVTESEDNGARFEIVTAVAHSPNGSEQKRENS